MTRRIVLFSLGHGGHHPPPLSCLLQRGGQRGEGGELHVVVSETAAARHPDVLALAGDVAGARAHVAATPPGFGAGPDAVLRRERVNRALARRYADALD